MCLDLLSLSVNYGDYHQLCLVICYRAYRQHWWHLATRQQSNWPPLGQVLHPVSALSIPAESSRNPINQLTPAPIPQLPRPHLLRLCASSPIVPQVFWGCLHHVCIVNWVGHEHFFLLYIIFVFSWRDGKGVYCICILHTKSYDIFELLFLIIVMSFFLLCDVSFHKKVWNWIALHMWFWEKICECVCVCV